MILVTIDQVTGLLTSLAAFVAAVIGIFNHFRITEVKMDVNSRMTQLLELTKASSLAEGVKQERDKVATDKAV